MDNQEVSRELVKVAQLLVSSGNTLESCIWEAWENMLNYEDILAVDRREANKTAWSSAILALGIRSYRTSGVDYLATGGPSKGLNFTKKDVGRVSYCLVNKGKNDVRKVVKEIINSKFS